MSTSSSQHSLPDDIPGAFPTAATSPPVVTLTAEQSAAKAIELRDASGALVGVLVRDGGASVYYTAARLAELQRRAANPEPGRPLREFLDTLNERLAAMHKQQTGA